MGWTQAPVAPVEVEDNMPEIELDHHDEHLVRAAELYQEQGCSLLTADSPSTCNSSVVLSMQAEVEAEANRWAAEWNEGAEYSAQFPQIIDTPQH